MSNEKNDDVGTFTAAYRTLAGAAWLIDPTEELLRPALAARRQLSAGPTLHVLAPGARLRSFRESFRVASRAGDLVGREEVIFRAHDDDPGTTVLVGSEAAYVPVSVGTVRSVVPVTDEPFHEEALEWAEQRWADAGPFSLRTPPLSMVRETLEAEFGADARESFDRALATTERGNETEFDEVIAAIVVAAHHECLHYDLSRWGEDIGFASKATFSRKKKRLEEMGVIETEKVSVEMGRPRQRLVLRDTYHRQVREEGIESVITSFAY